MGNPRLYVAHAYVIVRKAEFYGIIVLYRRHRMEVFRDIIMFNFCLFCVSQFGLIVLAVKVKQRFKELGYNMRANPYILFFSILFFWSHVIKKNKKFKDDTIRLYLFILYCYWIYAIFTIILFILLIHFGW